MIDTITLAERTRLGYPCDAEDRRDPPVPVGPTYAVRARLLLEYLGELDWFGRYVGDRQCQQPLGSWWASCSRRLSLDVARWPEPVEEELAFILDDQADRLVDNGQRWHWGTYDG